MTDSYKSSKYVAYYNQHNIIPVAQNTSDPDFVARRNHLYTSLGIPLTSLKGKDIIEFGPGGGYNALATSFFKPNSYTFVDATIASLSEIESKVSKGLFTGIKTEIIRSNIFEFKMEKKFDLVIIEGVIPGQSCPQEMLKIASSFVNEYGYLITTTTSYTSLLSEVCRRLFGLRIRNNYSQFTEQLNECERLFQSHLDTFKVSVRSAKDWSADTILQDWKKNETAFTIDETLEALDSQFDYQASLPRFLIDDRWYKLVGSNAKTLSSLAREQYKLFSPSLIDHRIDTFDVLRSTHPDLCKIEDYCKEAFDIHVDILDSQSHDSLNDFFEVITAVEKIIKTISPQTSASIKAFIYCLKKYQQHGEFEDSSEFSHWWGKGQQYVSVIKKPSFH